MKLRSVRLAVAMGAVLALATCGSGGDGSKASPSSTAKPAGGGKSATDAFVDVETCDNSGGRGTSTGTIENQGSTAVSYTITIGFFDESDKQVGTGSDTTAVVAPGGSADWAVTASGLGSNDLVCHTVDITSRGGKVTTSTTAAVDAEFPCDLVTETDLGQIVGNPVDPGDAITNQVTEDTVTFTARECSWSATGEVDEVRLQVSRKQDNGGQDPGCLPYPGTSTPVPGIGTSAVWSWVDAGTTSTIGTLRVCSAQGLVDVTISGSTSGDAHLAAARAVAEKALAAL